VSFLHDSRGRVTIVEVLLTMFALAFVGALWPVVQDAIDSAAQSLGTGELYLFRLLLPLMLLVMLSVLFVTASSGGGR